MNVILFGPPGVGKGTLAKKLVSDCNMRAISTGDEFRKQMELKTEIGQIVQQRMDAGILIDDDLTFQILIRALDGQIDNILLDGFPRTLNQAVVLDSILKIDLVVSLTADESVIRQRIAKRQKTAPRSDDDKFEKRMLEYYTKTIHTLNHYDPSVLLNIDANQPSDVVFSEVLNRIK